ncbi:hypothetical protein J6590_010869 [Homalodisca vitripennis]|nr:hypothetical protein J6590_010869 [Homalodisca vitripennis]
MNYKRGVAKGDRPISAVSGVASVRMRGRHSSKSSRARPSPVSCACVRGIVGVQESRGGGRTTPTKFSSRTYPAISKLHFQFKTDSSCMPDTLPPRLIFYSPTTRRYGENTQYCVLLSSDAFIALLHRTAKVVNINNSLLKPKLEQIQNTNIRLGQRSKEQKIQNCTKAYYVNLQNKSDDSRPGCACDGVCASCARGGVVCRSLTQVLFCNLQGCAINTQILPPPLSDRHRQNYADNPFHCNSDGQDSLWGRGVVTTCRQKGAGGSEGRGEFYIRFVVKPLETIRRVGHKCVQRMLPLEKVVEGEVKEEGKSGRCEVIGVTGRLETSAYERVCNRGGKLWKEES